MHLWALWTLCSLAAAESPLPSVAVMGLVPKEGVRSDVADQLTEAMVTVLRRSQRFSRVVSAAELRTIVSLEQQKQLLDCGSTSCMSEVAGALGANYVVSGTVGRMGSAWLFNINMLDVNRVVGVSSVTRPVEGPDERVLLTAVDAVVAELLGGAFGPEAAAAVLPPEPPPAATASPVPLVLRVTGAGGMGLAALTGLAGVAAVALTSGILALSVVSSVTYLGPVGRLRVPLLAGFWGGLGVAPLLALVSVAGLVTGVGLLGASFAVASKEAA